jgi:hypothetical protein
MALWHVIRAHGRQLRLGSGSRWLSDHRSTFEDKEEALEKQYMYQQNKKTMEQFTAKMVARENQQGVAKQELCEILGQTIPEDVMKKLFAWKDKHSNRNVHVT